jgi:hypothetical protein
MPDKPISPLRQGTIDDSAPVHERRIQQTNFALSPSAVSFVAVGELTFTTRVCVVR